MIFTRMSWSNLFSFGDYHTDFTLDREGITFVKGINKDTGGTNGVGKSAIIDVFSWVLFGKTVKDIPVDAVRCMHTKEAAHATIEFWQGQDLYEINRYRGHKEYGNGVHVKKNGAQDMSVTDGTNRDAQDVIDSILGIDYHGLTASIVFSTEMPLKLPKLSADRRRAYMESLMGMRAYSEYGKTAKAKTKTVRKSLDETIVEEREKKTALASQKEDIIKYNGMSKDFNNTKAVALTRLETLYGELTFKIENIDVEKIDTTKKAIEVAQRELKDAERETVALSLTIQQLDNDLKTLAASVIDNTKAFGVFMKNAEKECNNQIKVHKQRIELMQHECPTCQRGWEGVDVESHNATHNAEIERLSNDLVALLDAHRKEHEISLGEYSELISIKTEQRASDKENNLGLSKLIDAKHKQIEELTTALKAMPSESDLVILKEQRENLQKTIESKASEQNPYKKIIDDLTSKIQDAMDVIDTVTEKKVALESELKYLSFWDESFNNDGLKLFIFETIIPILNTRIAHYLPLLFENHKTRCEFDKMMNMFVFVDGNTTSYGNLSQGERKRVDLAIALALLETAQSQHGMTSNVMFLDEIFDSSLDEKGTRAVMAILHSFAVKSMFVISHRNEISDLFDSVIEIEKHHNFSHIVT